MTVIDQTLAARRRYYDRVDWSASEPYQIEVLRDLIALLPEDVGSILDLGCGNGYIANALAARRTVIGVDISAAALRHLTVPGCLASAAQLPFPDRAFDLVITSEVIEHLPASEFAAALGETQRVARRYIITSVPFAEDLVASRRYSAEVDALRHVNDHMRAFDLRAIMSLYPEFEFDSVVFTGVEWLRESRPVEAFNALMIELGAASLAEDPSETVLSQDQAADILQFLRADQARTLGRTPGIVDSCRLRTVMMGLYRRRSASGDGGRVGHAIRRTAEIAAALPVSEVDLTVVDFRQLDRHQQPWLRMMTRFPYVVTSATAVATPQGTRFAPCEDGGSFDLKIGFFCNFEGIARLEITGVAEAETTLLIAHYGADNRYRHLARRPVAGRFCVAVDDAEFSHSQYGILFSITVEGGGLALEAARIATPEPTRRAIYAKPVEYLHGDGAEVDCFLSCRHYGRDIPVLEWFKDPRQVRCRSGAGGSNLYVAVLIAAVANIALKYRTHLTGCAEALDAAAISSATLLESLTGRIAALAAEATDNATSLQRLTERIEALKADSTHGQERIESLQQQVAQRFASLTGELQALRHEQRLRRGTHGLIREMLNVNDYIGTDGRPKPGLRLPFAARLYFRLRRARDSLFGDRAVAQVAAERPQRGDAGPAAPRRDPASTVTVLVPDDRIDRRVLLSGRSLSEAGWNVTVVAAPYPGPIDQDQIEFPELHIVRIDTGRAAVVPPEALLGNRWHSAEWQEVYFYHFNFLELALRHPARVYVANDLPVLPAAAVAAVETGAALVYDAHELFPEIGYYSAEQRALYSKAEADLIKGAALVTTINQSIAEEMVHRYGIPTPEVILNAPAAPARSAVQDRALLRRELQISPQQRILLYQGAFSRYRNLEDLIAAMAEVQNTNIVLVMMGPSVGRREDLEAIAREDGTLGRRVLFHDAVPQEVLLSYTSGAEIGIVPYPAVDLNSRYCAPNKLFEFIVAGVPILANDLPELRKFVHDTGFGQVYQLEGSAAIARAIDLMFRSDLQPYRERLAARRQEFTWAAQGEKLVALYEPLAAEAAIHAGAWRARDHKEKSTPLQQNVAE